MRRETDRGGEAARSLRIELTDAGRNYLALRLLARQAVRMLENPCAFRRADRRQLARTLQDAIGDVAEPPNNETSTPLVPGEESLT